MQEKDAQVKLPRIRDLVFSPNENPLMDPGEVPIKKRLVRSGTRQDLVNPSTGEVAAASVLHQVEEKDEAEFVKVFSAGVRAMYELTQTAHRVFQVILDEYQRTPMSGGYADTLYLVWFNNGLSGKDVGMSEATFNRGLRELLAKSFLAPKTPNVYWVNPALFFKGDRVMFVKEYRKKQKTKQQAVDDGRQKPLFGAEETASEQE